MAEAGSFDLEIERIGARLIAMRAALDGPAALLTKAAREKAVPDAQELADEQNRRLREADERLALETELADRITVLAEAVERQKTAFEKREVPNRVERALGTLSKRTMARLVENRWTRFAGLDKTRELLRQVDVLCGLLTQERQSLLDRRKALESDLVQFVDQRGEMVEAIVANGDAQAYVDAVAQVEASVQLFSAFIQSLNGGVATCNILLHKLSVETEELLILYRVLSDLAGQGTDLDADPAPLANLGKALERFRHGRLIGRDLDRLRQGADAAFVERSAAPAAGAAEPAGETEPAPSNASAPA